MRNKIWAVVFTIACVQIGTAEGQSKSSGEPSRTIDSLLNVLKTAREDTGKVNTQTILSEQYYLVGNLDTAKIYADEASKLSEKMGYKKGKAKALIAIGEVYSQQSNNAEALKYFSAAKKISEEIRDKKGMVEAYKCIGNVYRKQGDYPEALKNLTTALKIGEEIGDKMEVSKAYHNLGTIYMSQSNYAEALKYFFASLKITEENGYKELAGASYGNIGNIYIFQGNYPESLKYHIASLKIAEEFGNKERISSCYNNIALIYYSQGDFAEALKNTFTALKIKEEIGEKHGASNCYVNIGELYGELGKYPESLKHFFTALKIKEEIGDKAGIALCHEGLGNTYRKQNDFTNALKHYFAALNMNEETGDQRGVSSCHSNIGNVYSEKAQYPDALDHLNKSLQLATELSLSDLVKRDYSIISQVYERMNDWKNAFKFQKLYFQINDSLFNEENKRQITEMQTKYETEKNEKEIVSLTKNNAIQELEIKKQKLLKNSFFGGFALLLTLSFFVYNNFRIGNKLKLQNIRNRIASDLHDDVGSTLNSISVYSEVAKQKSPAVVDELEHIGDASRKIIEVMSDIVWTINPKNDTFECIILRMSTLTYNLLKAKNIEHTFQADENLNESKLSLESRRNFYLIFKEALNNLVKYSNATRASITLTSENGLIKLAIRDNGIGFDVAQTSKGNGLLNMKSRADEMNAQLKIESEKGTGTNVELILKA